MAKLKMYRERKGMSQKELENISGVSVRVIQNYEQGQRNFNGVSGERLYRLALALGCRPEELLEDKEEIEMDALKKMYAEWRRQAEKHNKEDEELGGSVPLYWDTDCGEESVREDFSTFAGLDEEISFDDMLALERDYNSENI